MIPSEMTVVQFINKVKSAPPDTSKLPLLEHVISVNCRNRRPLFARVKPHGILHLSLHDRRTWDRSRRSDSVV